MRNRKSRLRFQGHEPSSEWKHNKDSHKRLKKEEEQRAVRWASIARAQRQGRPPCMPSWWRRRRHEDNHHYQRQQRERDSSKLWRGERAIAGQRSTILAEPQTLIIDLISLNARNPPISAVDLTFSSLLVGSFWPLDGTITLLERMHYRFFFFFVFKITSWIRVGSSSLGGYNWQSSFMFYGMGLFHPRTQGALYIKPPFL